MKKTPLFEVHVKLGARMVPFGGWDMPVLYSGIIAEHKAVRSGAGIFDIGHMGVIKVSGPNSFPFLQRTLTNDLSKLAVGSSHYSIILNNSGGVIDDIFVYRMPEHYMIVLNASNTDKDIEWFRKNNKEGAEIEDLKGRLTLFALQGPKSQEMLQKIVDIDLKSIGHHKVASGKISNVPAVISRTGYTGEDGFELFFDASQAEKIWNDLAGLGALPCGLGARDTLRLEAGMPLYGHEYNEGLTPLEAGFGFAVKLDKGDFLGREALLQHKDEGFSKKLVGLRMTGPGIPRQGFQVFKGDRAIGYVTSGTMSPTLNVAIGMAYLRTENAGIGEIVDVGIRGRMVGAEIVKLPFYKRH